uniref:Folate receptor-like domain-containing protein n=1 Tax=Arion vulgaris TaxID=1028688 RepID=A0A0B6YGV3_9EUPU
MNLSCAFVVILLHLRYVTSRLNTLTTVNDYMNICLDGKHQKSAPGPEPKLLSQLCDPWASRACCTAQTAEGVHISSNWLNFSWNHCRKLSDRCREHFLMDLCFMSAHQMLDRGLLLIFVKSAKKNSKMFPCVRVCVTIGGMLAKMILPVWKTGQLVLTGQQASTHAH